jgi:ribonuclease HII
MPRNPKPILTASLHLEQARWDAGFRRVVGLDEVGRGTWAGPVTAAAVCLPDGQMELPHLLEGVMDSKQVRAAERERLVAHIRAAALACGVGSASSAEVDALGIVPATRLAMRRALAEAGLQPDFLLLDAMRWPEMAHVPQQSIIRGDSLSLSIAAASILAKVWRDAYMREMDTRYPNYGFAAHKGYGTAAHRAALEQHGPCPLHRLSFAPLQRLLQLSLPETTPEKDG